MERKGRKKDMGKNVKKAIAVVVVILLVVLIGFRFFKKEDVVEYETRPTVATQQPQTGDIVLYTDVTGVVEPQSKAIVMPKMSGEVLEIYFQAGDRVEAGQALVKIDSDALTSLSLQVDAAKVALDNANNSLARTRALYADGFASQEALEQVESSARSAQISYDSAKNQYDLQVEYTTVSAPIAGVIESRGVELHDHVSPQTQVCVISGADQMQVNFGVTEKTVGNLELGDEVTIEKNGKEFAATVTEIGSMVNSSGLYDVKAGIPESAGSLTNGTRVKITVVMDEAKGVMTVPVDAVSYDAGVPFVYCDENGKAVKKEIEAGIYDSKNMEVISGLDANSQVITTWSSELVDGQEVLVDNSDGTSGTEAGAQSQADDANAAQSQADGTNTAQSAADDGQVSAE